MNVVGGLISKTGGVNGFTAEKIDDDIIAAIFGAARVAPSADNVQMWRFVTVRQPEGRKALIDSVTEKNRGIFASSPLLIAALGDPWFVAGARKEQPFFMIDVPIAISHIILQAAELGIGCALEMEMDEQKVLTAVGAPKGVRAVAVLALGKTA